MNAHDQASFLEAAIAAFPTSCRSFAEDAARILTPIVNPRYGINETHLALVKGEVVRIPRRIHFINADTERLDVTAHCLLSRSTDGYSRQAAGRHIAPTNEVWTIPFVVLLASDYVVEIAQDLVNFLPVLDGNAYTNFVRENHTLVQLLRSRATSYWNCYYRHRYPDPTTYPGLIFLGQLENWAR